MAVGGVGVPCAPVEDLFLDHKEQLERDTAEHRVAAMNIKVTGNELATKELVGKARWSDAKLQEVFRSLAHTI